MLETVDPTLAEAIIALVLALVGAGAGFEGGRRGRRLPNSEPSEQLTALTQAQSATTAKLAEVVTKLDHIVSTELARIDERAEQAERSLRRLAGDIDSVNDALVIIVTHVELPESAHDMVRQKLQRSRRHEVTGVVAR